MGKPIEPLKIKEATKSIDKKLQEQFRTKPQAMSKKETNAKCFNCNSKLFGDFCSDCGRPQKPIKINWKYIVSEIGNFFNFDKGILFTIKELLLRPGMNIQKFILEDRNRLVKPIVFIIVCSLAYSISQQLFHFEDGYVGYSFGADSTITLIFDWVTKNYGYSNILMAVFIAFWIKIFFRKYGYNFFEILILLCFVMGMGMLVFSFFGIADSLTGLKIIDKGFLIGTFYIAWAIGQFFDKKKYFNYLKAFLSYFLGVLTFTLGCLLIGRLIDLIP